MSSEVAAVEEIDDSPPTALVVGVADGDSVDTEADPDAAEVKPVKGDKRTPAVRETKAMSDLRNSTDTALKEWMEGLSPNGGVKVRVSRTSPKVWQGMNVGGSLATYDHYIDEDWIREHHGGGHFMLEVKKPRNGGAGWVIAGNRAIAIAGDPRTDDVFRTPAAAVAAPVSNGSPAAADVVKQVLGTMERQLDRAQQQGANTGGTDPAMLQMLLAPLQQQLANLQQLLRDKDAQLAQVQAQRNAPVELDPIKEKMFSALIDGDSARVTQMRATHESEIRQLQQSARDTEARLRDQFDRDRASINSAHDREIASLRSGYDMKVAAQETLNQTVKTLLEAEIKRLDQALVEARSELMTLREKKDKTILEQAKEFSAIKEAIGDITGDDGDEKKSTIAQIVEVAGSLPAVQGVIERLSGGGQPAQPPPQQVAAPRPPQLLTGPDGTIYRMHGNQMIPVKRPAAPAAAQQATPEQQGPKIPDIAPATIKIAVEFLETAYKNGQEASEVATSVRSMIPADVLAAIRELGIDGFLTQVAKLDGTSPLSSQGGRNWTRKLGKSLLNE